MADYNLGKVKGDKGDTSTITIGTVQTVEPSDPAAVTNTGTSTDAIFNFQIPKGETGDAAGFGTPTAEIEIVDFSEDPEVTITASGESTAKVFDFNFKIPKANTAIMDLNTIINGGRNLLTVLGVSTVQEAASILKTKSDNHDYSGLQLGDYLDITCDYGTYNGTTYGEKTVRYEIVAFEHYNYFNIGATDLDNEQTYGLGSITFLATRTVFNNRIGESTNQHMYIFSPLDNYLHDTLSVNLSTSLGVQLKSPYMTQCYNDKTYENPVWDDDLNIQEWGRLFKVYLPSIQELYGASGYGYSRVYNSIQFPLIALSPNRITCKNESGSYTWCWTRTPSQFPGRFCRVDDDGDSNCGDAGSTNYGVRPAFNL